MEKKAKDKPASLKSWKRKCWRLMSEWVRREGSDFRGYQSCYTCRKRMHWKELHCGHYQHGKLDFDERNLRPQCAGCNTYRGGMLDAYTVRLIEENGKPWVDALRVEAAGHRGYRLAEVMAKCLELKERLSRMP